MPLHQTGDARTATIRRQAAAGEWRAPSSPHYLTATYRYVPLSLFQRVRREHHRVRVTARRIQRARHPLSSILAYLFALTLDDGTRSLEKRAAAWWRGRRYRHKYQNRQASPSSILLLAHFLYSDALVRLTQRLATPERH